MLLTSGKIDWLIQTGIVNKYMIEKEIYTKWGIKNNETT